MREAELLKALSKGHGGVQVNMTKEKVTVSTRYRPRITQSSDILSDAAMQLGISILTWNDHYKNAPPEVIEALEAYNRRTSLLSE